jgi:hypothetical protein
VELLEHIADLCLDFKEASIVFSRVVAPACIPTSSVQGSIFPTSSPIHVVGGVFDDGYYNRDEVEP